MIRFGLRLTLAGGREAAVRLSIIALAVALGVGMLLTALAGINGVTSQNDRYGWLSSGHVPAAADATDPLWWDLRIDTFSGLSLGRVDVAATGPGSVVPPGMPRLPAPGEFYASPALTELLAVTPAAQLGDRLPGRQAGTLGAEALPSPDSLIAVAGYTPAELSARPAAVKVDRIATLAPTNCPDGCFAGIPTAGLQLILAVVAGALIFPLLILIGTATRLAAARREQRFAAMRLVGATPRQVSVVSAVESTVSAVAGTLAGFVLFHLFRDSLAAIPFTGDPMYPSDLSLGPVAILGVALGVPFASALAARFALRRVRISPLGVTRRAPAQPPRAWRLIPLGLGVAELSYFLFGQKPDTSTGQISVFLPGILIIMAGLVIAGPWLTMVGAGLLARRATRPATLIAARRLAADPKAGFRTVSGLVLALFVTTVAVGVMGSIVARDQVTDRADTPDTMFTLFRDEEHAPTGDPVPAGLTAMPGVRDTLVVRVAPEGLAVPKDPATYFTPDALASCADIARLGDVGRCAPGAQVGWVFTDVAGPDEWHSDYPAAAVALPDLAKLKTLTILVRTDGSAAAREGARTILQGTYPMFLGPITDGEWGAQTNRVLDGWKQLANVVVLVSLVIAGGSLAVSVAGGLTERKRPFSMLRLTGVSLGTLRRVVALESVTPLLIAAAVALGAGLLTADLFLRAQMDLSLTMPGFAFYAIVGAGLVASLAIIASTLPLLRRITGPEVARNE
jgi:hypothetical protein